MPQTTEWSYDDYAALPDDGNRYEIIDGEVYMTPSPATRHQLVAGQLFMELNSYVKAHRLGLVIYEVDLLFVSGNYLQPDLLFVPRSQFSGVVERGVEARPQLVVEVLSPQSSRFDRGIKPAWYRKNGVAEYWVVDPVGQLVEQYALIEPAERPLVCGDLLSWQPDPLVDALVIQLPDFFERARNDL